MKARVSAPIGWLISTSTGRPSRPQLRLRHPDASWLECAGGGPDAWGRGDTLTVHQHVHPGMVCEAADRFAALLEG